MVINRDRLEELLDTQNKLLEQMLRKEGDAFLGSSLTDAEEDIRRALERIDKAAKQQQENALEAQALSLKSEHDYEIRAIKEKFNSDIEKVREEARQKGYDEAVAQKNDEIEQNRIKAQEELAELEKRFESEKFELRKDVENELTERFREQSENMKREYQAKVSDLESKLAEAEKTLDSYVGENDDIVKCFSELEKNYGKILAQIFDCRSMESYRRETNLLPPEKGAEAVIRFVRASGQDYNLARDIRNSMQKYRRSAESADRCSLTADELVLIRLVNEFYRKEFSREDENDCVLFLPDNCTSPSEPARFNSSQMIDIDRPSETKFNSIKAVYAPCFRRFDSLSIEKAVVSASEDKI